VLNDVQQQNNRQFHMRESPFGQMVNPLFETGERIHFLSRVVNEQQGKMKVQSVPEEEIQKLPTVEHPTDIDCSICLEELNKGDIPE